MIRIEQPTITLSGVDERVSQRELERLLAYPHLELGLLYTHTPEGRPRYPELLWLIWAAEVAAGRCAVHICGRRARAALLARELDELVAPAKRIQINGTLSAEDVATACALYPRHTVITQHHEGNAALVALAADNHALLVDASGGTGHRPERWARPATTKAVGFAGGLGPSNLATELPLIAAVAGAGPWWVDMEQGLRLDDRFSPTKADNAVASFRRWREAAAAAGQGGTPDP